MTVMAIYGCWKGHSSKREAETRILFPREIKCSTCEERANLFEVFEPEQPKMKLTVIDNTKSDK